MFALLSNTRIMRPSGWEAVGTSPYLAPRWLPYQAGEGGSGACLECRGHPSPGNGQHDGGSIFEQPGNDMTTVLSEQWPLGGKLGLCKSMRCVSVLPLPWALPPASSTLGLMLQRLKLLLLGCNSAHGILLITSPHFSSYHFTLHTC